MIGLDSAGGLLADAPLRGRGRCLIGLLEASSAMIDRLGAHDKPRALDLPAGH